MKKNVNIELIRIVACLMVVMIHTLSFNRGMSYNERIFLESFLRNAVALFWMITGYFLFASNKKYFIRVKKFLTSILFPTLVLIFVTQLFAPWLQSQQSIWHCLKHPDIDWELTLTNIFGWTSKKLPLCAHLWYVFTYMRIMVWLPLLQLICKNEKKKTEFATATCF